MGTAPTMRAYMVMSQVLALRKRLIPLAEGQPWGHSTDVCICQAPT